MATKVITSREFRENQKKYFDLAETQKVAIKRGNKIITLVVNSQLYDNMEDWFNDFFSIPEQYRCNPFDYTPSGDLFYADKRNIESIKKSVQQAKEGKVAKVNTQEELSKFLDNL